MALQRHGGLAGTPERGRAGEANDPAADDHDVDVHEDNDILRRAMKKRARKPKIVAPKKKPSRKKTKDAMSALLALTAKLTESRPLEESLRAVTDAALALLPANHASIRLLDGSHSELLSGARSGAGTATR